MPLLISKLELKILKSNKVNGLISEWKGFKGINRNGKNMRLKSKYYYYSFDRMN
jgi:hypothetical protein